MDDRETLIELLKDSPSLDAMDDDGYKMGADHLIANGVTVQQWIPVEERLPKENGAYLICWECMSHRFIKTLDFVKKGRFELRGQNNVWYEHDSDWRLCRYDGVTHWMPLPEPPKEGE